MRFEADAEEMPPRLLETTVETACTAACTTAATAGLDAAAWASGIGG
jgi:hypothetical protein